MHTFINLRRYVFLFFSFICFPLSLLAQDQASWTESDGELYIKQWHDPSAHQMPDSQISPQARQTYPPRYYYYWNYPGSQQSVKKSKLSPDNLACILDTPRVSINELRISSPGNSDDESNYVEFFADPGFRFRDLALVVLSGEFEPGKIDFAFDLSQLQSNADGLGLLANPGLRTVIDQAKIGASDIQETFDFFGSPTTFLLVEGFTGNKDQDLDNNNDGRLDITPWTRIVDGVSLINGDEKPDFSYSAQLLGPNGNFAPAGLFRFPDGIGDFNLLEFNDLSRDTPGRLNQATSDKEISVRINELRISSPGSSDNSSNFVELFAQPGTSLANLFLLVLSGEFEPGKIDFTFDLSGVRVDEDSLVLIANEGLKDHIPNARLEENDLIQDFDFFSSPTTFLLVEGLDAQAGDDLDTDNDGELDNTPWVRVLDALSLADTDERNDQNYSENIFTSNQNQALAGLVRIPHASGELTPLAFDFFDGDSPGTNNGQELPDLQPRVRIPEIQGAGHLSPLVNAELGSLPGDASSIRGRNVRTQGLVTAVDTRGFYLQDPQGDGNPATSDAIYVFMGEREKPLVGDEIEISGRVEEFFPGRTRSRNLPVTQLRGDSLSVISQGNALPAPVILGQQGRALPSENIDDDAFAQFEPESDALDLFESLESMRVKVQNPLVISPVSRFREVFVVADNGRGATGLNSRNSLSISPDDFNPEKIQIDENPDILPDFELPEINPGARLGDVTGVLGYDFGNYQIFPTEVFSVLQASDLQPEETNLRPAQDLLRIASYNVLNLDAKVEDINRVNNQEARNVDDDLGNGRFQKIAQQIVQNLKAPDIIALQEVQDNDGGEITEVTAADQTLQALIEAIKENQGPEYAFVDNPFVVAGAVGGQPGGNIRTAFLYNPQRVTLVEGSIRSIAAENQATNERNPFYRARLPLVADFTFQSQKVTLINNHFSSKGGSAPILGTEQPFESLQEDASVNGSLDERRDQAIAVKRFVEDILDENAQANIVVMGDFNEFEFVSPLRDLLGACLENLTDRLPEKERHTFSFQGNAQSLDHMLISPALEAKASYDQVRVNSEFSFSEATASDHDPVLVGLKFGGASSPVSGAAVVGLAPQKDAFLGPQGGVNNTTIELKDRPEAQTGFLQFDMRGVKGNIRKAELLLYPINQGNLTPNVPVEVLVYLGDQKEWEEDQLSKRSSPDTLGAAIARIKTIFYPNLPYTFTLDISRMDISRPLNLILYLKAPENYVLTFASKEHPSGLKARLKLTPGSSAASSKVNSKGREANTSFLYRLQIRKHRFYNVFRKKEEMMGHLPPLLAIRKEQNLIIANRDFAKLI